MAYNRDITADDKIFFDTNRVIEYRVWQGDPTTEDIESSPPSAVPEDVSGMTFGWTLRKTPKASTVLIQKTMLDGISITGTFNADPAINTQRVRVALSDKDTYDPDASPPVHIKGGNYHYALKRLDTGVETIVTWGKFTLLQAAAWEED